MTPHLIYIAFWYPPSRASGTYRAIATTRGFVDAGWDVTVITTTPDFLKGEVGSVDDSLLAYIPSGVGVIRVPFTFADTTGIDVRSLGRLRANLPTLWTAIRQRSAPIRDVVSVIKGETADAHQFTDNYVAWIDPVVKNGMRVNSSRPVDHILATGNPFSSFEAARLLAGMLGIGYSIDFRDPWTVDVFTGNVDHADRRSTVAERLMVAESEFCFHVNEAIADAYRAKYPESADKHRVVYNGYDIESIPSPSGPASIPLRFGMLGTMNENWPAEAVFGGWVQSRGDLPEGSELVLGGHLGYFARSEDLLEAYLPDESMGFSYVGPVPKAGVADFYGSLDVIILPVPGGAMVTSGKVFEAMAVGKPIVCVQKAGGGARLLLENHPLAIGAEPTVDSVGTALLTAASAALDLEPRLSLEARARAEKFERHLTMAPLVDSIDGLVRKTQPA